MKHLLTAIAFCLAVAGSAQTEWPWNPDYDSDQIIGMTDFLPFLGIFGDEFILEMPEDAPYTLALAYLGDMPRYRCISSCRKRNGRTPTLYEMELFEFEVDSILSRPYVNNSGLALDTIPYVFPITLDKRDYLRATLYERTSSASAGQLVNRVPLNGWYYSDIYTFPDTVFTRSRFEAAIGSSFTSPDNLSCFCVGTILNE